MAKSLLNKIGNAVKGAVLPLVLAGTMYVSGCNLCPDQYNPGSSSSYSSSSSSSSSSNSSSSNTNSSSAPSEIIRTISGSLQDNESDSGQPGIIKVYDGSSNLIRTLPTEANGNFNIKLTNYSTNTPISNLILQGRITNNLDSYVRTVRLNGTTNDTNGLTVRAVPAPNFGEVTKEQFRNHMGDINFGNPIYPDWHGLKKFYLDNLNKITIFKTNSNGSSFSDSEIERITNKIRASWDIEKFAGLKELDSYIELTNCYTSGFPESGNIWVVPDTNMIYGGLTQLGELSNTSRTGIIDRVKIRLANPNKYNISHEFGHAFVAPNPGTVLGEYTNIPGSYTIMNNYSTLTNAGPADEKAGKLVYESTYAPRERLDDILGTNWIGE